MPQNDWGQPARVTLERNAIGSQIRRWIQVTLRTRVDQAQVIATLRAHRPELHRSGIRRLYLFGSVARGQERPDSDVDLFFDTDNPKFSLVELVDAQERIKAILGIDADVMTRASLHPLLRPQIEADAVQVF